MHVAHTSHIGGIIVGLECGLKVIALQKGVSAHSAAHGVAWLQAVMTSRKMKAARAAVADNVMVFTKKGASVAAFLEDTITCGGGVSNAIISEIINKDTRSTEHKLFKVKLDRTFKGALFKGLAIGEHDKDFRVAHEIPYFLKKTFGDHEKFAYSIRKHFREISLKTKID